MPIREGLQAVKDMTELAGTRTAQLPAELYRPLMLQEIQNRAQQFLDCYRTCRDNKGDHCLAYCGANHEVQTWHIGLMFIEYVAGLLLKKAEDGHCYAENRTNPVCEFSRAMHLRMLGELQEDLRKLADEIDRLRTQEEPTWTSASSHPTPP